MDKIILTEFFPGCRLANQMYQFAAGFALTLLFPEFKLKVLNNYTDLKQDSKANIYPFFDDMIKPYIFHGDIPVNSAEIVEMDGEHIPYENIFNIIKTHDFIRLKGWFQSEYWFFGADHLSIKNFFIGNNYYRIADRAKKYGDLSNTVGIHIRMGDYTSCLDLFRVPKFEWYIDAYNKHFLGNPVLVSSNDMKWCREVFKYFPYPIQYLDEDAESCIYILSKCKGGFIGSNSSYSTISAWIGDDNSHKIVFPSEYYNHSTEKTKEEGYQKPDNLIPDRWIKHPLNGLFI